LEDPSPSCNQGVFFSKTNKQIFQVCNNFAGECPDKSNHRLCPGSSCGNSSDYFRCEDDKFCIIDQLICDGHIQCEDGSDEEFCTVCPHPNKTHERTRTFPCRHRYTGRPICANPCDGYDDLCEDYSDEDCEGVSFIVILFYVGIATLVMNVIANFIEQYYTFLYKGKNDMETADNLIDILSLADTKKPGTLELYLKLRNSVNFPKQLCNLIFHLKHEGHVVKAKEISRHFYQMEVELNTFQTDCADVYYFIYVSTNKSTEYF
jgi:hypothetical protein